MDATARLETRPAVAAQAAAVPLTVFAIAFAVRVLGMAFVKFPLSEGSAYYVAVARNLAMGRGLVTDAVWSYATPPLTLPRPAFELWQPLASVLATWPMSVLGTAYSSAQLGFAAAGALVAPLAWLVARDAANRLDLPANRRQYIAIGAGLLTAVAGPFVLAAAIPDSTLPFTVLAVAACVAMPNAARGDWRAIVALGLLLGLAYLTRMEAVYLAIVFVAFAWTVGARGGRLFVRVGAVAAIGALVALPWWIRNFTVFGTPAPGQLVDNALLTRNEQIFAWQDPPTLAGFLNQGPGTIVAHIGDAVWHNFGQVLMVPGNFVVLFGLITLILGWRSHRIRFAVSPLWALLIYGALVFLVTSIVFPIATLWGTFEHAAGPLLVAFVVLAAIGGDTFVARLRTWRGWPRPNAGMAPAALTALVFAVTLVQLASAGSQAQGHQREIAAVADYLRTYMPEPRTPVITNRPMWLSDGLGVSTLAVPDESSDSVVDLARRFGARAVVIVDPPASGNAIGPSACLIDASPRQQLPASNFLEVLTISGDCR